MPFDENFEQDELIFMKLVLLKLSFVLIFSILDHKIFTTKISVRFSGAGAVETCDRTPGYGYSKNPSQGYIE